MEEVIILLFLPYHGWKIPNLNRYEYMTIETILSSETLSIKTSVIGEKKVEPFTNKPQFLTFHSIIER